MTLDFYFGIAAGAGFALLAWLAVALYRARHDSPIDDWDERAYAPPCVTPPEFRPGYRAPPAITRIRKDNIDWELFK